jgi:hypothetical protein
VAHALGPMIPRVARGDVVGSIHHRVRLTYYIDAGTMYSGRQTFEGAAAAHLDWLPIGTRFTLDCLPGQTYTVLDTGMMATRWVDLFVQERSTGRWIASTCGDWATLRIVGSGGRSSR